MKIPGKASLFLHTILVCSAGVAAAYFVQFEKAYYQVDHVWNSRLLLLSVAFGLLTYLIWRLESLLYARLRQMELGKVLQADAYSYMAFYLVILYPYIQRDFKLTPFLIAALVYFLFLKLVFLLLLNSRTILPVVAFSASDKGAWKPLLLLAISIPSYYFHQTSLAAYTASLQQKTRLKIGKEVRNGVALPWDHSVSFDLNPSGDATLCLPYGFTQEMLAAPGEFAPPGNALVRIQRRNDKENVKIKVPITREAGWRDIRIDLAEKQATDGPITVTVGTKKHISWLWSNPASPGIAFADAFTVSERRKEPNIILITVDALRPDHISAFGHDLVSTPAMDSLVRDGFSFPRAVAPGTWTKPSNIAMMTSIYPERNVLDVELKSFPHKTLTEALAEQNYVTMAVSDAGWISSETAFMNGFNTFSETMCRGGGCRAKINFDMAKRLIDNWKGYPFFIWIYLDEVHNTTWHDVGECGKCLPDKQDARIAKYDSALESLDLALEGFLSYLKQIGLYDESIILLTADHGNAFGEDHENTSYVPCGHGGMPYNEQSLVPLIIKPQKELNAPAGKIIDEFVSGIDVAPTLLDLARLPRASSFEGISLLPAAFGDSLPEGREIYSSQGFYGPHSLAMIKNSMKILYPANSFPDKVRIYDLARDPGEQRDISDRTSLRAELTQIVEKNLAEAEEFRAQASSTEAVSLSKELSSQLRALGYIQ